MSEAIAVVKREPVGVEYVPYGAQDKIKLSVNIVQNLVAVKTKSGKTCSETDAIKFLAMCQAKRMNPFEGDCFLIGYDGKDGPTFSQVTAHQTYLKRAELHPEYDGMKSGIIVQEGDTLKDLEGDFYTPPEQKVVGGWATVYFKSRKHETHRRIRLSRFQKPFGIWQDDAAGMICKCAEADALRSSFPTMLGGLYMREELDLKPAELSKPDFSTSTPLFLNGTAKSDQTPEPPAPEPAAVPAQPEPKKAVKTPAKAPDAPKAAPKAAPEAKKEPEEDDEREKGVDFGKMPATNGNPANPAYNVLKAVKGLCNVAGVTPEQVITFLQQMGSIDEDVTSLEELAMLEPNILSMLDEQAADIFARIKGETK